MYIWIVDSRRASWGLRLTDGKHVTMAVPWLVEKTLGSALFKVDSAAIELIFLRLNGFVQLLFKMGLTVGLAHADPPHLASYSIIISDGLVLILNLVCDVRD